MPAFKLVPPKYEFEPDNTRMPLPALVMPAEPEMVPLKRRGSSLDCPLIAPIAPVVLLTSVPLRTMLLAVFAWTSRVAPPATLIVPVPAAAPMLKIKEPSFRVVPPV